MITRTCANGRCQKVFQTYVRKGRPEWARFCSKKCWHVIRVKLGIATNVTAANSARREWAKRRTAAQVVAEVGQLSDRDIALIRRCLRIGYTRGYKTGWRRAMRDQGLAA